ncbi:MAG: HEAT repeat domain-containing protein [Terracidiphilus sp.]
MLHDTNEDIGFRQLVAWVLVKIGPASIPTFVRLLNDQDEQMRSIAAWGSGEIGSEASSEVPDPSTRFTPNRRCTHGYSKAKLVPFLSRGSLRRKC